MLESSIEFLQTLPWIWILVFALFITFLENIFPPAPSDVLLVFIGSLVGLGVVGFVPTLLLATIGSTLGFLTMYYLGRKFGIKIVDSNRYKFINSETLRKPEELFRKYGDLIIVLNRFLSGTRAVISFFAGISKLTIGKTTVLSAISALVWNFILIYVGMILGENWRIAEEYMTKYGKALLIPTIVLIIIGIIYYFVKVRKKKD